MILDPKHFDPKKPALDRAKIEEGMIRMVPHARAIGMRIDRIEPGDVWVSLPYDERFVGDPNTGVIHGGIVSTLLDASGGLAVFSAVGFDQSIATLGLRIDYMKPATPHKDVRAHIECYKVGKSICLTRGFAFHESEDEPIAAMTATFARKS